MEDASASESEMMRDEEEDDTMNVDIESEPEASNAAQPVEPVADIPISPRQRERSNSYTAPPMSPEFGQRKSTRMKKQPKTFAAEIVNEVHSRPAKKKGGHSSSASASHSHSHSNHNNHSSAQHLDNGDADGDYIVSPEVIESLPTAHVVAFSHIIAVMKKFFLRRLAEVTELVGGNTSALTGWDCVVNRRSSGLLNGMIDVTYYNVSCKRFRSRVDCFVGLSMMPTVRSAKNLSRDAQFLVSMELREKFLLSCKLSDYLENVFGSQANSDEDVDILDDIAYEEDEIKFVYARGRFTDSGVVVSSDALIEDSLETKQHFYCFLDTTVLNWGTFLPDPAFHSATQLFPCGFKCIQQKIDLASNCLVDCLCEIDKFTEVIDGVTMTFPLFRITIDWGAAVGAPKGSLVRVYEARSPQQAWQVAMLETCGTDVDEEVSEESEDESSRAADPMDQEEMDLRKSIRDQRRIYFRAVRNAQTMGLKEPAQSRLSIESFDNFVDELVGKLFEGMDGAVSCGLYQFSETRYKETGKRWLTKHLDKWHTNSKAMGKLLRIQYPKAEPVYFKAAIDASCINSVIFQPPPGKPQTSSKRGHHEDRQKNDHHDSHHRKRKPSMDSFNGDDEEERAYNVIHDNEDSFLFGGSSERLEHDDEFKPSKSGRGGRGRGGRGGRGSPGGRGGGRGSGGEGRGAGTGEGKGSGGGRGGKHSSKSSKEPKPTAESEAERAELAEEQQKGITLRQTKTLMTAAEAVRKAEIRAKVRDFEKNVRQTKEAFLKNVRRFREEAKMRVELLCDKEEVDKERSAMDTAAENEAANGGGLQLSRGDRPLPSSAGIMMALSPYLTGQVLELWGYLHTFAKPLKVVQIPNLNSLIEYFRSCDITVKDLRMMTRKSIRSQLAAAAECFVPLTSEAAASKLNEIGVVVTAPLVKDYIRMLGLDPEHQQLTQAQAQALAAAQAQSQSQPLLDDEKPQPTVYRGKEADGMSPVPLNSLTWREIARTTLLGNLLKDIGLTDGDVATATRGRSFGQLTDYTDRKILKLIRRRITFNYSVRADNREILTGFHSGVCVRAPAPSPCVQDSLSWRVVMKLMLQLSPSQLWLMAEFILVAIVLCQESDIDSEDDKVVVCSCLRDCLEVCKTATVAISRSMTNSGNDDGSYSFPSVEEAKNRINSLLETYGDGDSESISSVPTLREVLARYTGDISLGDHQADTLSACYVPETVLELWNKHMALYATRFASIYEKPVVVASAADENVEEEYDDDEVANAKVNCSPPESEPEIAEGDEDTSEQVSHLSEAMQRCYLVIKDLMAHNLAAPFCKHVDPNQLPQYSRFVHQPVTFTDIRQALLQGTYEDSIVKFYSDVNLLLENALAYNPENSFVNQSAGKLQYIFERMFLECVLNYENPMLICESCVECKSVEAPEFVDEENASSTNKNLVCDRCEAWYHSVCLNIDQTVTSLGAKGGVEWFCPGCVEQRGVAIVHPNKTSSVIHPFKRGVRGQVVGIDQIKQSLKFVVLFGNEKESWTATQVRQFAYVNTEHGDDQQAQSIVACDVSDDGGNEGSEIKDSDSDTSSELSDPNQIAASGLDTDLDGNRFVETLDVDSEGLKPEVVELPSGYSVEDLDLVCSVARGYTGYGSCHGPLPSYLSDIHCLPAWNRSRIDPFFNRARVATAILGNQAPCEVTEYSADEWIDLLRAVAQRASSTQEFAQTITSYDSENESAISSTLEKIFNNACNIKNLIRQSHVQSGDSLQIFQKDQPKPLASQESTAETKSIENDESSSSEEEEEEDDDDGDEIILDSDDELFTDDDADDKSSSQKNKDSPQVEKTGSKLLSTEGTASLGKPPKGRPAPSVIEDDDDDEDDEIASKQMDISVMSVGDDDEVNNSKSSLNKEISPVSFKSLVSRPLESPASFEVSRYDSGIIGDSLPDTSPPPADSFCNSSLTIDDEQSPLFKDWETRRASRKKAREDALLTKSLLRQAMIDLSTIDENVNLFRDPEIYRGLCLAVIKNCMIRPSESINMKDWESAWLAKLKSLVPEKEQADGTELTVDSFDTSMILDESDAEVAEGDALGPVAPDPTATILCKFCGFDQYCLASQFVWGQTWGEWETEGDAAAVIVTDKRKKLSDEGGRTKVWMPTNAADAEVERAECEKCSIRFPRKGSVVVHECCAEFMTIARQVALGRVERAEEQRIVDILVGVGRAKTTPLGCDSNGHLYWVFSGCSSLFVCMQPNDSYGSTSGVDGNVTESLFPQDLESDSLATDDFKAGAARYINASSNKVRVSRNVAEMSLESVLHVGSLWLEYKEQRDIGRVITWLRETDPDEKMLKKVLLLLYPNALRSPNEATYAGSADNYSVSRAGDSSGYVGSKRPASVLNFDSDDDDDATVTSKGSSIRELSRRKPVLVSSNSLTSISDYRGDAFAIGQRILTETSNGLIWSGKVLEIKDVSNKYLAMSRCYVGDEDAGQPMLSDKVVKICKIGFDNWGHRYDAWLPQSKIYASTTQQAVKRASRMSYLEREIASVPQVLSSMKAVSHQYLPNRWCSNYPPHNAFSDAKSSLSLVKYGLYMICRALPHGALDENEEKWGPIEFRNINEFGLAWREAVVSAASPSELMACQLLLEFCIKPAWLKPSGAKLLSSLPSKAHAMKYSTVGMVAIRMFILDDALRYDKVNIDEVKPAQKSSSKSKSKKR
jgi:hypothetical protein